MYLGVPTSQGHARLDVLILEILSKNLTCPLVGNIIGVVIGIEEIAIVRITILVVGRDIVIICPFGGQSVFFSLSEVSSCPIEGMFKTYQAPDRVLWTSFPANTLYLFDLSAVSFPVAETCIPNWHPSQ